MASHGTYSEALPGIISEEVGHISHGHVKMKELCGDGKGRREKT